MISSQENINTNEKEISQQLADVSGQTDKLKDSFERYSTKAIESISETEKIRDLKKNIGNILTSIQEIERVLPRQADVESIKKSLITSLENKITSAKENLNKSFARSIEEFNEIVDKSLDDIRLLNTTKRAEEINELINQNKQKRVFAEKVFYERCTLIDKMNKQEYTTLYNVFIAFLILFGVYTMIEEYFEEGTVLDLSLFNYAFGKLPVVINAWIIQALITFSIIGLVQMIKDYKLSPKIYFPIYAVFQIGLYTFAISRCLQNNLPPASALVVSMEAARMSMKMHGYFREKLLYGFGPNKYITFIPDWAKVKGATVETLELPVINIKSWNIEFHRFLYFFFCPSLIYRDEYLRNQSTNWYKVFLNLLNLCLSLIWTFVIFKAFAIPNFKNTAENPGSLRQFVSSVFYSMISGTILFLVGFFAILHSWLNAWGEMLRFADRRFYEDWWNVRGFASYYRKWNIIVHEFLYYYVYKDCIRFSNGRISQTASKYFVFLLSAIIHEIIISCALGFFFPLLFFMFGGPGVLFSKIREWKLFNIFFWSMMLLGNGLLMVLLSREYYARLSPDAASISKDGILATMYPQSFRLFSIPK